MTKHADFVARTTIADLYRLRRYRAETQSILLKHKTYCAAMARDSAFAALESSYTQRRRLLATCDGFSPIAIMDWAYASTRADNLHNSAKNEHSTALKRFDEQQSLLVQQKKLAESAEREAARAGARYRQRLDEDRSDLLNELHQRLRNQS